MFVTQRLALCCPPQMKEVVTAHLRMQGSLHARGLMGTQ